MTTFAFLTPTILPRSTFFKPHQPLHSHLPRHPHPPQTRLQPHSSLQTPIHDLPSKPPSQRTLLRPLKTLTPTLKALFTFLRLSLQRLNTIRRRPLPRLTLLLLLLLIRTRAPIPTPSLPFASISIPHPPLPTLPKSLNTLLRPFTEAFGVVFLSEFGDKSMFATALMAMKQNPVLVFIGALVSLTLMTLIACFLGQFMQLLPPTVTHYSTIALFVFFGAQMIWQSRKMSNKVGQGSEKEDAAELVKAADDKKGTVLAKVCSLIFVAEWCDRSMLATMALAASSNTLAVVGGATAANVLCTGLAVVGAALVSSKISERVVAIVSGVLFEVFAVTTFLEGPEGG